MITADGRRYRWTVAPDDEPGLGVVVEDADHPAQRLVTWVGHGTVVGPGLVRTLIHPGREQGWSPEARGPELTIRVPVDRAEQA